MSSTNENKVTFDNIKLLSSSVQNDIPVLAKNVKDAKRQLDLILLKIKDKENEFAAAKALLLQAEQERIDKEQAEQTAQLISVQTEEKTEEKIDEIVPETVEEIISKDNKTEVEEIEEDSIEEKVSAEVIQQPIEEEKPDINIEPKTIIDTVQVEPVVKETVVSDLEKAEKVEAEKVSIESVPVENEKPKEVKVRKSRTAEEKFLDSLPKPVNQENKRIINILPERREKPKSDNIKRYTAPERYDRNDRNARPRPSSAQGSTTTPSGTYSSSYQGVKRDYSRPTGGFVKKSTDSGYVPSPLPEASTVFKTAKKKVDKSFDTEKKEKVMNKRTLIRRGFETDITLTGEDEYRMGSKKFKVKKKEEVKVVQLPKIEKATVNTEIIPIKTLSDKLGITAVDITKKLFKDGIIKTINETIDFESAALMAADIGIELELKLDKTAEDVLAEFHEDEDQNDPHMVKRPPIITVMGHVDHGKTSLLDAIKNTNIAAGEAGGITQQIGAYTIKTRGEMITFIDTPGHEAFTAMRARGASVTDIAVLVVAADDGIMPQTIEAINHAKAANVPIIVAVNKMDKPNANLDRIKQQLTEYGLVSEEWGGDTIICPVSAVRGDGIDHLLDMLLLVAEVKELKANPDRKARGTVIEAKLDKGKGPVATVLIQNGSLKVGDTVVAGVASGRIRAMIDDKGRNIKEAGPSIAVAVLGFSDVPNAGDPVFAVDDEKLSKLVAEERINKIKTDMTKIASKITLDDVFDKIAEGQVKGLNIIVKADFQGSVEAVSQALLKLSNDEVKVSIIHSGVGAINESDVTLAQTASAIIIGFSVRPETKAKLLAERENVDIRLYRIIYDVTDDVEKALKGMLAPKFKETVTGQAEVRNVFKITGVGAVAGCYVISGKIIKNAKIRLLRDNVVITEGSISSLKRFKDDVKEVAQGYECGISIENYNDIKDKDVVECFIMEEIKQ